MVRKRPGLEVVGDNNQTLAPGLGDDSGDRDERARADQPPETHDSLDSLDNLSAKGITDSASVLPVQVFRWSDFPERAFEAKTGAAISVLLVFLVIMNAIAIVLRRRFERRW